MTIDAQDVTNLLTLALAVATVWLAVATHIMAKATREAVALQAQPFLAVEGIVLELGQAANIATGSPTGMSRLALHLSNPGQVRIMYEVEAFNVTFNESAVQAPTFLTRRGVIHPKAQAHFYYPSIQFSGQLRPGLTGEVMFKIAYWATLHEVHHVSGRIQYTLQSVEPGRIGWLYLEGPDYV